MYVGMYVLTNIHKIAQLGVDAYVCVTGPAKWTKYVRRYTNYKMVQGVYTLCSYLDFCIEYLFPKASL